MMKVMLFSNNDPNEFINSLNSFIADKKVIDIKYGAFPIITEYDHRGVPENGDVVDRALVIYEEGPSKEKKEIGAMVDAAYLDSL